MIVQVSNLTATVSITRQGGSDHYEITSIRDEAGNEVVNFPILLLDQIEEAVEDNEIATSRISTSSLLQGRCHNEPSFFSSFSFALTRPETERAMSLRALETNEPLERYLDLKAQIEHLTEELNDHGGADGWAGATHTLSRP